MPKNIYDIQRDTMIGTTYNERKVLEDTAKKPWLYRIITQGADGNFYLMGGIKITVDTLVNPGTRPTTST